MGATFRCNHELPLFPFFVIVISDADLWWFIRFPNFAKNYFGDWTCVTLVCKTRECYVCRVWSMADDEAESEPASKNIVKCVPTRERSPSSQGKCNAFATATAATATATATTTINTTTNTTTTTPAFFSLSNGSDDTLHARSILIERSECGFGFTLRHFIVYPPESSAILACDGRLGFGRQASPNEPIDTIFVKNVRENGPAHVAGLATGDRIVSVNGQDISGLSYLKVVNLIFKTEAQLHLVVVAQENDALQLYFGEAAHHPQSNQKSLVCSPFADISAQQALMSSNTRHYSRNDSHWIRPPSLPTQLPHSPSFKPIPARHALLCRDDRVNTSSSSSLPAQPRSQIVGDVYSCCGGSSSCSSENMGAVPYSASSNFDCAYSLDVEFDRSNYDSTFDSNRSLRGYLNGGGDGDGGGGGGGGGDHSIVMNRLKKSLEQKQEFLNRLPYSTFTTTATTTTTTTTTATTTTVKTKTIADAAETAETVITQSQPIRAKLKTIFSPTSASAPTPAPPPPPPPPPPSFQIVSVRAKQFENGPINDKTELFRSELARLSVKHNVANVATRRRDFENRAQLDLRYSNDVAPSLVADNGSKTTDNDGAVVAMVYRGSGNRTVPVGSKKLHCEPPSEFLPHSTRIKNDDKTTRRISYLKATTAYSMNVDCENELSEIEPVTAAAQVAPQRSIFGSRRTVETFAATDQEQSSVLKEGNLFCKIIQVEGKKASDRSWKPIWLILKGRALYLFKDKKESSFTETPATFDKSDLGASCDRLDIGYSVVDIANDYTKRKHVFRLNAPSVGTELLLQAQDASSMSEWVTVLREQAIVSNSLSDESSVMGYGSSASSPSANAAAAAAAASASVTGNKTLRKLASLRTRSPTGDVPSNKTKKLAPHDHQQQTSPKTKTWKNKMAKQFRKMQPGASSPIPSLTSSYPAGATIGIPLELCPSSTFSEYVPSIVQVCTDIVEAKGLEIIGIYRVPGNTAAVTSLTEAVNRGLEITTLDHDPRWSDVNVISSLLKSFFRKLPDALLTSELYPNFIKSDAIDDPIQRMIAIRKLVHNLPDHNFETLKYLLFHLKKVVANSTVNKMEARNLAIVFGPTLIRSGDDMFTMVTDMSHQCRIVESLLSHVDWCFGSGDVNELKTSVPEMNSIPELEPTNSNHTLLLGNIRKVEGCMQSPTTAKDFVSTIIGAANRKMHKTSKHLTGSRKTNVASTTAPPSASISTSTPVGGTLGNNYTFGNGSEDALDSSTTTAAAAVSASPSIPVVPNIISSGGGGGSGSGSGSGVTSSVTNVVQFGTENATNKTDTVIPSDISTCENDENIKEENRVEWTYPKLSAETKERIRKFEEETEALLQRCTNSRRLSGCISEETEKEKTSSKNGSIAVVTKAPNAFSKSDEQAIHDSPPPVVVTRRNLPSNFVVSKKLTRHDAPTEKYASSASLNRTADSRPSSRHSDDGCDLLMMMTTTFDKKLKSLSNDAPSCEEPVQSVFKTPSLSSQTCFVRCVEADKSSSFRDPSLHRNVEKSLIQKAGVNLTSKENEQHGKEKKDVDEKESERTTTTTTVSCSGYNRCVEYSEAIQQNCDNWKRSALQEMQSLQNRLQNTNAPSKRETKLFYSNSVKLRRSESLKEDNVAVKLRRSGSLNKHEPTAKISKFESLMLFKNAEATKLRRSESLSKSEKTETNLKRRQQMENSAKKTRNDKEGKLKRRNAAAKTRNIKRRHTVGGTKDFDKVSWLQNQQQRTDETDKENRKERRTSSPDLSSTRLPEVLFEVVVRPNSFITADANFVSRLLNIPLESHV